MAAEEPMTIGELGRLVKTLAAEIRDDRRNYLAIAVWEVEKRALETQRDGLGREIGQLRTKLDGIDAEKEREHKAIDEKIAAVKQAGADEITKLKEENRVGAEQARKDRAKVWVSIGIAGLGAALAVATGVATSALNQVIAGGQ